METIGLIAAMSQESGALFRHIKKWERAKFGQFRGARFRLMERDCVSVTTGMGLRRAMEGTRALLAATNPDVLVSFGIAGAVKDDLNIGDVVVSDHTCLLETGLLEQPQPLASLSEAAWNAAYQVLQQQGAQLVRGTAITTRGSQVVHQSLREMAHPILEMETAGIAQVAAEMGIPLVSIRSISDGPQAPIPIDLGTVFDDQYNLRIGKLLTAVLRKPQIILQSRGMMKNSRKAADLAARGLVAALSQPSFIASA